MGDNSEKENRLIQERDNVSSDAIGGNSKRGHNSVVLTTRNALIVTVIALAFNPIYVIIGYHVSKGLRRPRINIEFANAVIEYKKIRLPTDMLSDLRRHQDIVDKLLQRWLVLSAAQDVRNVMKYGAIASSVKDGEITFDFAEEALEFEGEIISEYDVKIEIIKENIEILSAQEVFDSAVLIKVPGFKMDPIEEVGRRSPKAAYDVFERWLKNVTDEKDVLKRAFSSLRTLLENGKERSGGISFEVGLLNGGDTDGVLYPEGELSIGGRKLKLIIEEGKYGVIKPHSFMKYVFKVKEQDVAKKDLDYLNGLVINSIPEPYVVITKTSSGTISNQSRLPVN